MAAPGSRGNGSSSADARVAPAATSGEPEAISIAAAGVAVSSDHPEVLSSEQPETSGVGEAEVSGEPETSGERPEAADEAEMSGEPETSGERPEMSGEPEAAGEAEVSGEPEAAGEQQAEVSGEPEAAGEAEVSGELPAADDHTLEGIAGRCRTTPAEEAPHFVVRVVSADRPEDSVRDSDSSLPGANSPGRSPLVSRINFEDETAGPMMSGVVPGGGGEI